MGKAIFAGNFDANYATADITIGDAGEQTGYEIENIRDFWDLSRHWRSTTGLPQNVTICTIESSVFIEGLYLSDVNFTTVTVWGLSGIWVEIGTYTCSQNDITGRYQIYIEMSGTYKEIKLTLPSQSSTDGEDFWRLGAVAVIDDPIELTFNIAWGLRETAEKATKDIEKASGSRHVIALHDKMVWKADIALAKRPNTSTSELWEINRLNKDCPLLFYLNDADTSEAYLCVRDKAISITHSSCNIESVDTLSLLELV